MISRNIESSIEVIVSKMYAWIERFGGIKFYGYPKYITLSINDIGVTQKSNDWKKIDTYACVRIIIHIANSMQTNHDSSEYCSFQWS